MNLHLFTFLSQNTPRKGVQQVVKIIKFAKKHPPDLAWKSYLQKGSPKCENLPLQRFKPISKGPRYTEKHRKLDPRWTPDLQFVCKLGTPKNNKKQAAKKSSTLPK